METPDQTAFIRRIRTALGQSPDLPRGPGDLFAQRPSAEELDIMDRVRRRSRSDRQVLLDRFVAAGRPIHLSVTAVPDGAGAAEAVADLAAGKKPEWGEAKSLVAWRHPLIDGLSLSAKLASLQIPLHVTAPVPDAAGKESAEFERRRQREAIAGAFIGVTSADFGLAETATLVLRNRPGQPRSAALVPSIHIAVVTLEQIVADMKELFALLRWDERYRQEGLSNYMSFVSGPSKTADIEATMVHGAHGPREMHLFVITGPAG